MSKMVCQIVAISGTALMLLPRFGWDIAIAYWVTMSCLLTKDFRD